MLHQSYRRPKRIHICRIFHIEDKSTSQQQRPWRMMHNEEMTVRRSPSVLGFVISTSEVHLARLVGFDEAMIMAVLGGEAPGRCFSLD